MEKAELSKPFSRPWMPSGRWRLCIFFWPGQPVQVEPKAHPAIADAPAVVSGGQGLDRGREGRRVLLGSLAASSGPSPLLTLFRAWGRAKETRRPVGKWGQRDWLTLCTWGAERRSSSFLLGPFGIAASAALSWRRLTILNPSRPLRHILCAKCRSRSQPPCVPYHKLSFVQLL